ncbi:hypothetical protein V6N13_070871 [Hibiscus sabdariffa]|uniref:Uncharacterized protein n=1 Tax=Hibiscus sabdariffa TaxID=183260 RepID=A0ABR2TF58_9ROSI
MPDLYCSAASISDVEMHYRGDGARQALESGFHFVFLFLLLLIYYKDKIMVLGEENKQSESPWKPQRAKNRAECLSVVTKLECLQKYIDFDAFWGLVSS